jgi:NAD(P)-dependent dehydrogenase (short-subunit alcohol dehydrogenase family)
VVVCDVNEGGLATLAEELGPGCALRRRVDVSDREAMRAFADEVHGTLGTVDVLVNNAGVGLQGGLLETSLDDWDWILGINLKGVVHGCHFFVPPMVSRGRGHVVNVASILGLFGAPGTLGYSTAKFGVVGLSESLRAELEPKGVKVSTICPGVVDTGIIAGTRFAGQNGRTETVRAKVQDVYQKRAYGPERVAAAILDAVRKQRALVPVTPEAWALYLLKRFAPGIAPIVGRLIEKQTLGK